MVFKLYKKYIKRRKDHLGDSSNKWGSSSRRSRGEGAACKGCPESEQLTDTSASSSHLNEEQRSLLVRIGGANALHSVVELFYEMVLADETLMRFFEGVDVAILSLHQKRFLSLAFTQIPKGISVESMIMSHHKRLFEEGLNETHFDKVAQHLVAAMKAHDLTDDLIGEAVSIVAPLRTIFEQGGKEASPPQQSCLLEQGEDEPQPHLTSCCNARTAEA